MSDDKITIENSKLLALTEHPTWGVFVGIVERDMKALDSISSLYVESQNRDELAREIEIRYHTIIAIRGYISETVTRATMAQEEQQEEKSTVINQY